MKALFLYDGSKHSDIALDCLQYLPIPPDSRVDVLTVAEPLIYDREMISLDTHDQISQLNTNLQSKSAQSAQSASAKISEFGYLSSSEVSHGKACVEALKKLEESDYDLVILGASGMGRIEGFLLGSVSQRVLRHAHQSVLIVHDGIKPENLSGGCRLLLAYDGSISGDHAVEALNKMESSRVASVKFLHVAEPLGVTFSDDVELLIEGLKMDQEEIKHKMIDYQQAYAKRSPLAITSTQMLSNPGNVGQQILDQGEKENSDLILMGSEGKSGLERLLLGSVSLRVAEYSNKLVWIDKS